MKFASFACILDIDDAEFYIVCPDCYELHRHEQWSGSTKLPAAVARRLRKQALAETKECEFCGRPLDASL